MEFKTKTYRVVRRGRLGGTFPGEGEITIHTYKNGEPSGAIIIRCPVCSGLQHKLATIEGPDDAPTIREVFECDCIKCTSTTFRIRAGRVYQADPEEVKCPELSEAARDAGVFYPSERGWKK
jgi:hypothetical protein